MAKKPFLSLARNTAHARAPSFSSLASTAFGTSMRSESFLRVQSKSTGPLSAFFPATWTLMVPSNEPPSGDATLASAEASVAASFLEQPKRPEEIVQIESTPTSWMVRMTTLPFPWPTSP
jgi:hypothetical protein